MNEWEEFLKDVTQINRENYVASKKSKVTNKIQQQKHSSQEAEIDLHNQNLENAYNITMNFIRNSIRFGRKNVVIITGKGQRGEGLIKNSITQWLLASEFKEKILKIEKIYDKNRESGAFRILLSNT